VRGLAFALAYCGLFKWILLRTHTIVEALLGEAPQTKVEAGMADDLPPRVSPKDWPINRIGVYTLRGRSPRSAYVVQP